MCLEFVSQKHHNHITSLIINWWVRYQLTSRQWCCTEIEFPHFVSYPDGAISRNDRFSKTDECPFAFKIIALCLPDHTLQTNLSSLPGRRSLWTPFTKLRNIIIRSLVQSYIPRNVFANLWPHVRWFVTKWYSRFICREINLHVANSTCIPYSKRLKCRSGNIWQHESLQSIRK